MENLETVNYVIPPNVNEKQYLSINKQCTPKTLIGICLFLQNFYIMHIYSILLRKFIYKNENIPFRFVKSRRDY